MESNTGSLQEKARFDRKIREGGVVGESIRPRRKVTNKISLV